MCHNIVRLKPRAESHARSQLSAARDRFSPKTGEGLPWPLHPSPAGAGRAPRIQWQRERAFKKASITVKTPLASPAIGPESPPLLEAAPTRHRPRPQPGGFDVTTEKVYEASEQISCGKKVSRLGQGVIVSQAGPVSCGMGSVPRETDNLQLRRGETAGEIRNFLFLAGRADNLDF